MKNLFLTFLSALFFSWTYSQSCTFEWAETFGASNNDSGKSIVNDEVGNVYVAGVYSGTVDFDSGNGVTNLSSAGSLYVQKLDPDGNLLWVKSFSEPEFGAISLITSSIVDDESNILVVGVFSGALHFNTLSGTTTISSSSAADIDGFVSKLDPNGNFLWVKSFGSNSPVDMIRDVAVDSVGNIYSVGSFWGTTDFDPGSGIENLTAESSSRDVFIQKLDAAGEYVWAKRIGNSNDDEVKQIAVHQDVLFVTGEYMDQMDFNPSTSVFNMTSNGGIDAYVLSLSTDGVYHWAKSFGSVADDRGFTVKTSPIGEIYLTGLFEADIDLDPNTGIDLHHLVGISDFYVVKLNGEGKLIWAKSIGGTDVQSANCLAVNQENGIYVSGTFHETTDFDPNAGIVNRTSAGAADVFLLHLDGNGSYQWVVTYGNTTNSYGDNVWDISADNFGSIYSTGGFFDTVDFDPGNGTTLFSAFGSGTQAGLQSDIFIQKLKSSALAIHENSILEFTVYPNPANSTITISQETALESELRIIGLNGTIVSETKLNQQETSIDLNALSSGTYVVEFSNKNGTARKLICKQ